MSVRETLEAVKSAQKERQENALEQFAELVNEITDGDSPDPAMVETVLRDAGRTLEDLEAEIARFSLRRELFGVAKGYGEAVSKYKNAGRQIVELDESWKKAEHEYHKMREELDAVQRVARAKLEKAKTARGRLIDSASSDLKQRRHELKSLVVELSTGTKGGEREIQEVQQEVDVVQRRIEERRQEKSLSTEGREAQASDVEELVRIQKRLTASKGSHEYHLQYVEEINSDVARIEEQMAS